MTNATLSVILGLDPRPHYRRRHFMERTTSLMVSFLSLSKGEPRESYFAALSSEALFRTLPPSSCSII